MSSSDEDMLDDLPKPVFTSSTGDKVLRKARDDSLPSSMKMPRLRRKSTIMPTRNVLKAAFGKIAGGDLLTFEQFVHLCVKELQMDLAPHELQRVFAKVDMDGRGTLSFSQINKAIEHSVFFRNIVKIKADRVDFKTPADYDYSKSTNDNYNCIDNTNCSNNNEMKFYGKYADIRRTRDYTYHAVYTKERQIWQDSFVKSVVTRAAEQPNPWIVYTCGPMGAGKGYALSWMSRNGFFPLEDIVRIDPDYFKRVMPEWPTYLEKDALEAGTHCHRESGFLVEIAQEAAMKNYQNIWVDGSLRDSKWYSKVFKDIRRRYPHYRIAIFYVFANEEAIRSRIKQRAINTGRTIPEHLIKASLTAPDRSLNILTPMCDFVARINNDNTPVLEAFESIDNSHNWIVIKQKFARTFNDPRDFPNNLAPLFLAPTTVSNSNFKLHPEDERKFRNFQYKGILRCSFPNIDAEALFMSEQFDAYREKYGAIDAKQFSAVIASKTYDVSPCHPVNLHSETAKLANIPPETHFFCWLHPQPITVQDLKSMGVADRMDLPSVPLLSLFFRGGFAYFDQHGKLLRMNSMTVHRKKNMLQFGPGKALSASAAQDLWTQNRWKPVTFAHIQKSGAKYYAWICPGETLGVEQQVFDIYGGFAYTFQEQFTAPELNVNSETTNGPPPVRKPSLMFTRQVSSQLQKPKHAHIYFPITTV